MLRNKKVSNQLYISDNQTFRQHFLLALTKLGDSATTRTGTDEIRELLMNQVQDTERISLVLNLISEHNEHQKPNSKKETLKIIGVLAEVFEDKIVEFLPKILSLVTKRIKENDPQVHGSLSDSIGSVIGFGLRNLELDQAYKYISNALKTFYQLLSTGSKFTQIGAAMCIAKIVQSSPVECLYHLIDEITYKLTEILRMASCKSHLQIFECILSLILAVEDNVEKLGENSKALLPVVIENMAHSDWNVRKIAVEVIYTLSVLVSDVLTPYKHDILQALNECRFDKIKNVRDITITAINIIKDLPESNEPEKDVDHIKHKRHDVGRSTEFHQQQQQHDVRASKQQTRHISPKRREKNPDFFKAKGKKGDIEIFTKSPNRESKDLEHEAPVYDPTIHVYVPHGREGHYEYDPQTDLIESQPQSNEQVP